MDMGRTAPSHAFYHASFTARDRDHGPAREANRAGSVLGYLLAGVVIDLLFTSVGSEPGESALRGVRRGEDDFVIGMELRPALRGNARQILVWVARVWCNGASRRGAWIRCFGKGARGRSNLARCLNCNRPQRSKRRASSAPGARQGLPSAF